MDQYEQISVDYDALKPKEEIFRQEDFFRQLMKKYSVKTCLDCACGTGWHLFMLNKLGLHCAGSDLSNAMLIKAAEHLKGTSIQLKQENFRNLEKSWQETFDMIICMTTSFPHQQNIREAGQTLKSMYSRLNEGGIIVIDNGFADVFFKTRPKFIPARIHADQAFYFFIEYPDFKKVIFNILNVKKTSSGFDHAFETMAYLALGKKEFERLFRRTDFSRINYYGEYDFSEYVTDTSRRLIIIAQKK